MSIYDAYKDNSEVITHTRLGMQGIFNEYYTEVSVLKFHVIVSPIIDENNVPQGGFTTAPRFLPV
ncbi:hypothetical protein [Desulfamplus magnetovallimortis]|nr:hypothetical protein [Desulfamplus magnetovallimortis]